MLRGGYSRSGDLQPHVLRVEMVDFLVVSTAGGVEDAMIIVVREF